jgi:1,4-dihydroxy-2-naphthoate polyprenyltransferase
MKSILIWIMATRPQFLIASQLPVLLGTALAYYEQDVINGVKMLLTLLGISLCHAGFNVLNDYYDHRNQADDLNKNPLTPFAGGSRMIQQGILTDKQMLYYGLILLGLTIILGLYFIYSVGLGIFYIGVIGMMMGFFYSAPPLSLHSRGLGELTVAFTFGILTVSGLIMYKLKC